MPNSILYNVSTQSLALKKGNFWIGTGDVGKGPTSSTGYFDGVTPGSNQYIIYYNKSGSNRIYYCTNGDQVYLITNRLKGQNLTTLESALTYIATQSDMMCTNINYEPIVTNGLVLNLDAGFIPSYPRTGTTWYDTSLAGNNGTLTNGPTYSSDNGGSIVYDGTDDYVSAPNTSSLQITEQITLGSWFKLSSSATGNPTIILKEIYNSATDNSGYLLRNTRSNNSIYIALFNDSINSAGTPSNSINLDTWYYACGTYDGSQIKMYLNGVLRGTTNYSGGIKSNTSTLYIGQPSTGYRINGNVAVTQIYNRGLSASEVLQNYNAQKGRFGL